ncbi:uncharacterized protein [Prorops nasuta]|uniref:uncharacterized protein n=1 Tax=Prorops nasuta TaxID=863751 RepID=UPI0034CF6A8A
MSNSNSSGNHGGRHYRLICKCQLEFLICLILLHLAAVSIAATSQPEERSNSGWDRLSRFIPANSVYEQRDPGSPTSGNSGVPSLLHLVDENNVPNESKTEKTGTVQRERIEEQHDKEVEEGEDVGYEDYEEYEPEVPSRPTAVEEKIPREQSDPVERDFGTSAKKNSSYEGVPKEKIQTEANNRTESSVEYDYQDDAPRNQFDTYYYYYYDYDTDNNSSKSEASGKDKAEGKAAIERQVKKTGATEGSLNKSMEREEVIEEKREERSDKETEDESVDAVDGKEANPESSKESKTPEANDHSLHAPGGTSRKMPNGSVLIGEAVVSVVTTKSVVNGTFSVPDSTESPETEEHVLKAPATQSRQSSKINEPDESSHTTEDSRILASVQTSRSISGARFLPFPVIDRVRQIERDNSADSKSLESTKIDEEVKKTSVPESTESIIDKLDRVQSDLSSGLLSSGFRTSGNTLQLDVINERTTKRPLTTTQKNPVVGKFVPKRYNNRKTNYSSNAAPSRTESSLDSLEGLLPSDYIVNGSKSSTERAKIAIKWPAVRTTESSETATITKSKSSITTVAPSRSNVFVDDISAFLPPGYKFKKEEAEATEKSVLSDILAKSKVDISALLPPDYNKKKSSEGTKAKSVIPGTTAAPSVTFSAAPIVKSSNSTSEKTSVVKSLQDLFAKSEVDISALLPRDYVQKKKPSESSSTTTGKPVTTDSEVLSTTVGTTTKAAGLKIVFPSRPGGRKPIHKITTPISLRNENPIAVTPRIQKGWPSRATTEFTGWPTPSTTPISIEKLLEAARTATVASTNTSFVPMTSEVSTTSTTTTTTTTVRPTTPGICVDECEVAGTIRIVGNTTWLPELLDRNTYEWQQLANDLETEMNLVFSKSPILRKWYKNIRIDSFSQGSILVDYFIELSDLRQRVNTQELKVIFHDSLRTYNAERWNETRIGKGPIRLGEFMIDPKSTDFVVIPKIVSPQYVEKDDRLIPQWAIAVIVIGVGGLLFIIIFGVSVLVNRQNGSKLKPTLSAMYDEDAVKNVMHANHSAPMHRSPEYPKSVHTIWNDPDVSWNDKSFESTSSKILVDRPLQENKKYNMYDSWRSEWNGYYYNPSHTSSKFVGYDSTTNLSSRHYPDYDTNF